MSITREQLERMVALSVPYMQTVEERQAILYEIYVGNSRQPDFQLEGAPSIVCINLIRVLQNDYLDTGKNALQVLLEIICDKSGFQQKAELTQIIEQIAFERGKNTVEVKSVTAQIFIAYSHKQALFATRLADALTELGAEVWMDVDDIATGEKWHRAIHDGLNRSKVMLLIITPDSMQSENVEAEWRYFYDKRKPIIPIRLKKTDVNYQLHSLQHIDFETQDFDVAFRKLYTRLQEWVALKDLSIPPEKPKPRVRPKLIIASLILVGLIFVVAFAVQSFAPAPITPTPNIVQTQTRSAETTEIAILQATMLAPQTHQAQTENALSISQSNATHAAQTADARQTELANAWNAAQTATQQAAIASQMAQANQFSTTAARITATQLARDMTATEAAVRATGNVRRTQAIIFATETASVWLTETQVAHSTAIRETVNAIATGNVQQAIPIVARNPIETNSDWLPNRQVFNGVDMLLVPAGCFEMGSSDGEGDERPIHENCFDEPFWIDRYEVTNGQFEQFGGTAANPSQWTERIVPRQNVTWFEARAFCALRGVRLPTEAEWEYAARGPDNLRYPWGNIYNASRVNDASNSGGDVFFNVAPVTTLESGASWVGAYNMLGNVWEWVSSMYMTYPYGADHESNVVEVRPRVARGGSYLINSFGIRSSDRNSLDPNSAYPYLGFRCARDFRR